MAQTIKNLQFGRPGLDPWVARIPWRWTWLPTPAFYLENSHGQRSLAGYSPWGHKESDMTEYKTALHSKNGPLIQGLTKFLMNK